MLDKAAVLALLDTNGILYERAEHIPVFTIDEMLAAGIPHPEDIAKNLFVRDDKKRAYYLITVREDKRVDLKNFAARYGTRKLSFASESDLAALLGLIKGSVTPFGLLNDSEHRVKLFLDRDFENGSLGIHPNDNTATLRLKTADLVALLRDAGCEVEFVAELA